MKIIHTSDWHLGRSFGPVSLLEDQRMFTDWFVDVVDRNRAELVIIAGDIYDRAIAPREAIELFRETLRRLRATGAVVGVISGNHDGADRVSPYDDLLDGSGIFIRGGYEGLGRVIALDFQDGPLDLVLLPFLDPQAAPDSLPEVAAKSSGSGAEPSASGANEGGDPAGSNAADHAALEKRRRRTHHSVLSSAITLANESRHAPRSVAVAHAFVLGGSASESERELSVGGSSQVDGALFEPFSYTALGHLHRPQDVGAPTLRYSGTPLPYSFSEDHGKSVTLVDMDPDGNCDVSEIPIPVGRRVVTIEGPIDELLGGTGPGSRDGEEAFVRAVLTDRETVLDAKARLSEVYPLVIDVFQNPVVADGSLDAARSDIRDATPLEATLAFWTAGEGSEPDQEMKKVLSEAVAAATKAVEQ